MKRKTSIICRKKRYIKYMRPAKLLKTNVHYDTVETHAVCKTCVPDYITKLSLQVRQLKTILRKLPTPVDKNQISMK